MLLDPMCFRTWVDVPKPVRDAVLSALNGHGWADEIVVNKLTTMDANAFVEHRKATFPEYPHCEAEMGFVRKNEPNEVWNSGR